MQAAKVSDLTVTELRALIREEFQAMLLAMLDDPDKGLQLRPEIKEKLAQSMNSIKTGKELDSAQKVAADLGLEW